MMFQERYKAGIPKKKIFELISRDACDGVTFFQAAGIEQGLPAISLSHPLIPRNFPGE